MSAPPRLPVELRVGLVSTVLEEQEVGCAFEGDCLFGRSFQVYLQKGLVCEGDLAVTCLHEMVHVNQMLSRNLELNRDTSFIPYWRGAGCVALFLFQAVGGRQAHYLENRLMNEFKVSGEFASQQNCLGECAFV